MLHFRPSNNWLLICVLVLSAGFMLQFKVIYINHQKQRRIQEINKIMTEMADAMKSVEIVANMTSDLMNKLRNKYKIHKAKLKDSR